MRGRLATLLVVAVGSGLGSSLAGEPPVEAQRAPAPAKPPARPFSVPRPFPRALTVPCPIPLEFRPAFLSAARDARLPLAMLVAVAKVESNLRPNVRSRAGAHGLLQLMPATAAALALDPFVPSSNVLAGARYLRLMLDRFDSTELALAAYNAGPGAVAKAGGAPSIETAAYVRRVTDLWRNLNGCA